MCFRSSVWSHFQGILHSHEECGRRTKKKTFFFCCCYFIFHLVVFSIYRSQTCECNTNSTANTVNLTRNGGSSSSSSGNNGMPASPMMMMTPSSSTSSGTQSITPCTCASATMNGAAGTTFNINMNGGNGGGANADSSAQYGGTLLSSNAKFQAVSAIAVSQDGVINVADQGK